MIALIAKREFRTRALSKANLITSAIMVVLVLGGALIAKPFLADDGEPAVVNVDSAIAGDLVPYLEATAQAQDAHVVFESVDAPDTVDVDQDGALGEDIAGLITGPLDAPQLYLAGGDDALTSVVQSATQAAALDSAVEDLGGDAAAVSASLANSVPAVTIVGETNEFNAGQFFSGMVVVILLFFVLIQSASVIMMGVVEEKSSRVVEILLATVKPATLLGGKVLGVGMYSLLQAATMFLPVVFAAWYLDLFGTLDVEVGTLVANFAVWFVLGFALFTILFGGLAALVSRQEDIGAITTPMMFLMMAPLYLAIYLVPNNPDSTISMVLTQVPFFAPFMVPMRSAFGAISTGEVILAVALCVVTIPVLTWIAGRVYAGAVLNTGGRMKLAEAFKRG